MDKIRKLEAELAEERKIEAEYNKLSNNEYKLAVLMHDRFCRLNHTDMCSWFYEFGENKEHIWTRSEHLKWYNSAVDFLDSAQEIMKKLEAAKTPFALAEAFIKHVPRF